MSITCYLIAGESSGDILGARLMEALRCKEPSIQFYGVGGERMNEAGLVSLFPIHDIAVMGFVEIIPGLPRIFKRLKQTIADIRDKKPDVLITIDAPGFNRRIAEAMQPERRQGKMKLLHYVAPSVWAYRPERAKRLAGLYDMLLALLPFEPDYFEREGLSTKFVGHPVVEDTLQGNGAAFRRRHELGETQPLLCLLPGSRRGELKRHMPLFAKTVALLKQQIPDLAVAMLAAPGMAPDVKNWPVRPILVSRREKADLFDACNVALAKSGTVTMELAVARLPMVVTYKVSSTSARMMRKMMKMPWVNLVNILLKQSIIPEKIQEDATPETLAQAVLTLWNDKDAQQAQLQGMQQALGMLMPEGATPSEAAADAVLAKVAPVVDVKHRARAVTR